MKKLILLILIWILHWLFLNSAFWEFELNNIKYKKNIPKNETLEIDLSEMEKDLEKLYNSKIFFEWDVRWTSTRSGNKFERKFQKIWIKEINLTAYMLENWERKLLKNKNLNVFVYEESIPLIIDSSIWEKEINNFVNDVAKNSWVYIYEINRLEEKEIENINFLLNINNYNSNAKMNWDYIWVWWGRDFLFSVLSKLNREISLSDSKEKLNIVLMSPFNINVIDNYINNFLSNKTWINRAILVSDSARFQMIKTPSSINILENELKNNNFELIKLSSKSAIGNLMFVSKFVNSLSQKGFSSSSIYLVLIIPFLLTGISFMKHFIWLSAIWIMIPVLSTVLLFKIWLIATFILLPVVFLTNMVIWKIISKYNLLYTPKISFIIIINIVVFMMLSNLLFSYNLMNSNASDIIFIMIFIIAAERFITIIIWKEFREYKFHLINTIVFMLLAYIFFSYSFINIMLLAYPEIILFLIPINFLMWRFTWLRVTEYFRFKEIIKNIEE